MGNQRKSGLSVTSFVLAIVGIVLTITVIGAVLGIPLAILALIFAIIALAVGQKRGLAISGLIISLVTLVGVLLIGLRISRTLGDPIMDFSTEMEIMIENDPELEALLENEKFNRLFKKNVKTNIEAKGDEWKNRYRNDVEDDDDIEGEDIEDKDIEDDDLSLKIIVGEVLEIVKNTLLESKEEWKSMSLEDNTVEVETEEITTNDIELTIPTTCKELGGTRLAEFNECEYTSQEWCDNNNGTFNECASACRNDPEAEICTMQCVPLCQLS